MKFVTCSTIGDALREWADSATQGEKDALCEALDCDFTCSDSGPGGDSGGGDPGTPGAQTVQRAGVPGFGCYNPDNSLGAPGVTATLTWTETEAGSGVGTVVVQPSGYPRAYAGSALVDLTGTLSKASFMAITAVSSAVTCDSLPPAVEHRSAVPGFGCHNPDNTLSAPGVAATLTWTETAGGSGVGMVTVQPAGYANAYAGLTPVSLQAPMTLVGFNSITSVAEDVQCDTLAPDVEIRSHVPGFACFNPDNTLDRPGAPAVMVWTETAGAGGVGMVAIVPSYYTLAFAGQTPVSLAGPITKTTFQSITAVSEPVACGDLPALPETETVTNVPGFGCFNPDNSLDEPAEPATLTWAETGSETGVGTVTIDPAKYALAYAGQTSVQITGPITKGEFLNITAVSESVACAADAEEETLENIPAYSCHNAENTNLEDQSGMATLTWNETGPETGVGTVTVTPPGDWLAYSGTANSPTQIDITGNVTKADFNSITMVAADVVCAEEIERTDIPEYGCHTADHSELKDLQ